MYYKHNGYLKKYNTMEKERSITSTFHIPENEHFPFWLRFFLQLRGFFFNIHEILSLWYCNISFAVVLLILAIISLSHKFCLSPASFLNVSLYFSPSFYSLLCSPISLYIPKQRSASIVIEIISKSCLQLDLPWQGHHN